MSKGDVAVPCSFARPQWKVRLRGFVPLGKGAHACVNAAWRESRGRWAGSLKYSNSNLPMLVVGWAGVDDALC